VSAELNRLRWQCQRGMLELDHILRGFLDSGYFAASPETQRAFESLLTLEDADILDLVTGRVAPASDQSAKLLGLLTRRI
jgi:antitoxin CptB